MVDIIGISCAVFQMHVVVDGSENIFLCDMFRNQVVDVTFDRLFDLFDIGIFLQDLFQNRIVYFLFDAKFFLVNIYPCFQIYH